jgi:hypothetical protein
MSSHGAKASFMEWTKAQYGAAREYGFPTVCSYNLPELPPKISAGMPSSIEALAIRAGFVPLRNY